MNDTERLDKLERIEKQVRKRRWFAVANADHTQPGIILTWPQKRAIKEKAAGGVVFNNLRAAIDAAPEPPEAA